MKGDTSADNEHARISGDFGAVLRILLDTERRYIRLASIEAFVMPAIRLGQFHVIYSRRGYPLAFSTWAFLSEAVAERMRSDPATMLHLDEWNEGHLLWIMDFVATKGRTWELARRIRERLGAEVESVRGVRARTCGTTRSVDLRVLRRGCLAE